MCNGCVELRVTCRNEAVRSPLTLAGNPRTRRKQNGNDAGYGDPELYILSFWLPDPHANLSQFAVARLLNI